MDIPVSLPWGWGKAFAVYAAPRRDFPVPPSNRVTRPELPWIGGGVAGCETLSCYGQRYAPKTSQPRVTLLHSGPSLSGLGNLARQRIEGKASSRRYRHPIPTSG